MVDGARGVLNSLLSDVYIFTDALSGAASGKSPGYGLTLVAETSSGCLISAEACASQVGRWGPPPAPPPAPPLALAETWGQALRALRGGGRLAGHMHVQPQ